MTFWGERYRNHPLWSEVSRARISMNQIRLDPGNADEQQALAYAGAVLEHLERRKGEADPLEVTPSMLQDVQTGVANWANSLDEVIAESYAMQETVAESDAIMTALAAWPPMKPVRYLSGIS